MRGGGWWVAMAMARMNGVVRACEVHTGHRHDTVTLRIDVPRSRGVAANEVVLSAPRVFEVGPGQGVALHVFQEAECPDKFDDHLFAARATVVSPTCMSIGGLMCTLRDPCAAMVTDARVVVALSRAQAAQAAAPAKRKRGT